MKLKLWLNENRFRLNIKTERRYTTILSSSLFRKFWSSSNSCKKNLTWGISGRDFCSRMETFPVTIWRYVTLRNGHWCCGSHWCWCCYCLLVLVVRRCGQTELCRQMEKLRHSGMKREPNKGWAKKKLQWKRRGLTEFKFVAKIFKWQKDCWKFS